MKANRFLLLLLVILMSMTGAWAGTSQVSYDIVTNQFTKDGNFYSISSNEGYIVIKAKHIMYLSYLKFFASSMGGAECPNAIMIEGSNNQTDWTTILQKKEISFSDANFKSIPAPSTEMFQYFRITLYNNNPNHLLRFRNFELYEEKFLGSGTVADPYKLDKPIYLQMYANIVASGNNTACAILTANLDMDGTDVESIDNPDFTGTIDGAGYTIKNLNNAHGLFKNIGAAILKNLTIENATLTATDEYGGAFAAQANGTIFQNCIVKGTVSASSTNVGGLVGNASGATFTTCYAVAKLTSSAASAICGGLVGKASNNTQLTQCYSVAGVDNEGISPTFNIEIRPTYVDGSPVTNTNKTQSPDLLVDAAGTSTKWCDFVIDGGIHIIVSTGDACKLQSIRLWNGGDTQSQPGRRWKDIKVYGSSSAEGPWDENALIKSFTNLELAANNNGFAGELPVNSTVYYQYYKVEVLSTMGQSLQQMSDMKFVVASQNQQPLPVCGSTDGSSTATHCYHYGSTSSALSTSVEKADVTSGRLAYLLNNSDFEGPYFQRIGSDAYPHLTKTGSNYVYLAYDNVNYTNACPHRNCTIYPFQAPTCIGTQGQAEYGKCHENLCGKYFSTSDRNAVTTNPNDFILCSKAVNIQDHIYINSQDHTFNGKGSWGYSTSKSKDGTTYHNVMEVTIERDYRFNGEYVISYTTMDDDPTMNLHLFFGANMDVGSFSVRFYVNCAERPELSKNYPSSISEQHEIITIDGLHKFDCIKVVFNYGFVAPNGSGNAHAFIGTDKEVLDSHRLNKNEFIYNCIDGGHEEYYECDRCTHLFTQNTPLTDNDVTTWSNLVLAPVGAHNFSQTHVEGNLYGDQCKNEHCTTFDIDKYVLKEFHNDTDLPLTYDGNTYTALSPVSLVDGGTYVTPVAFDAPSLTYSRYYPENIWSAWLTPFDVNASYLTANGLTPAYIEGIHNYDDNEDGTIDRTVMEIVKISNGRLRAGIPLLVRAAEGYSTQLDFSDVTMTADDDVHPLQSSTTTSTYNFIGTYTGTTAAAADNIYSLDNEGAMVHRTGKILPLRWYCQIEQKPSFIDEENPAPALARAIYIKVIGEEDQTTGIRTLYDEAAQTLERADGIFDIGGRKLAAPQRGKINIINGKKQFVK